ncbi:hypothetical protein [Micromonospora purpureochromogenes]|uniref:Uncharacterized protein n=1 Tax=Micromonospora purpureochromogenes TaxID=47872 RepID=A0ABX2RH07_9ACTN|nr:hypothetical protein [Micromonospora purpureochromogenes]NYF54493.1 hypothetical protein [Micromonospora purpureochromogenes]
MRSRLLLLGLVTAVAGMAGIGVGLAGLMAGRPEMVGFLALGALALLLVVGLARDARRPRRRSRADGAAAGWYTPGPYGAVGADPGCGGGDGDSDSGRGGGSDGGGSGFWGGGFWGDGGSGSLSGSDGGGSSWGGSDGGGGGSY